MRKTISAVMIAAIVAGCNSTPKDAKPKQHTAVSGTKVSKQEFPSIRGYEIVKTYHLGRRLDPHNPNIMYEAGKMYVIRRTPTWNLRPHTPPVSGEVFANRIRPLKTRQEDMKKQQELRKHTLSKLEKVGKRLFENKKELEEINQKQTGDDLSSGIKEIQESQGRIKRKMAEFEK